jgi:antitoxin PrlF
LFDVDVLTGLPSASQKNLKGVVMLTTAQCTKLTSKGQVTVPKRIRDALQLLPGAAVVFAVNAAGEVVLQRPRLAATGRRAPKDRFDAVRGSADVPWQTADLMRLLRAED